MHFLFLEILLSFEKNSLKIFFILALFQLINNCILNTQRENKSTSDKLESSKRIPLSHPQKRWESHGLKRASQTAIPSFFYLHPAVKFSNSSLIRWPCFSLRRLTNSLLLTSELLSTQNQPLLCIFPLLLPPTESMSLSLPLN